MKEGLDYIPDGRPNQNIDLVEHSKTDVNDCIQLNYIRYSWLNPD